MEAIAQERAEKVLGQIRAGRTRRNGLPVDMSKGVAGALLTRSKDLRQRAVRLAVEADEIEQIIGPVMNDAQELLKDEAERRRRD
ncbi:MAG: hypothetical protein WDO18_01320 [Acidobacteriota bacterium]